jgi:hypothetical protein
MNAVAQLVGLGLADGPRRMPYDDPDEQVLLAAGHPESFSCCSRHVRRRSAGQQLHLLDELGVVAERTADAVAELLHVQARSARD